MVTVAFVVHEVAWYWTPDGALRECVVVRVLDASFVVDVETAELVDVPLEDVMIQQPE